ncbi:MAG: hypothetical protein WED00_05785 [Aquisalimonadaceae bacterium]
MANEFPAWFRAEVGEGVQRLVAIALPSGPGLDSFKLTAQAWAEALWDAPVDWREELDRPRLRAAFKRACRECHRWPAPRQVLDLLPSRPEPPKLPAPRVSEAQRRRNRRYLDDMLKAFGGRR